MRLDADNYPTEDTLEQIRQWRGTANALLNAVIGIWPHYGTTADETTPDGGARRVVLVTGGWSGCEQLIGALQQTLLWSLAWQESVVGGRHVLELNTVLADMKLAPITPPAAAVQRYAKDLIDAAARGGMQPGAAGSILRWVVQGGGI